MLPTGDHDEVEHSLVLQRMGEISARNIELIEIINNITIVASTWLFILSYPHFSVSQLRRLQRRGNPQSQLTL